MDSFDLNTKTYVIMEYYTSKSADINYNQDTHTVEVIWKSKPDGAGYQEAFTKGMEALKHFNSPNWLSDTTLQGIISPADRKWMETTILPQAIKNGLRNIAVVIPNDVFKKHYVNSVKQLVEKDHLTMCYFGDISSAIQWLSELQQDAKAV